MTYISPNITVGIIIAGILTIVIYVLWEYTETVIQCSDFSQRRHNATDDQINANEDCMHKNGYPLVDYKNSTELQFHPIFPIDEP